MSDTTNRLARDGRASPVALRKHTTVAGDLPASSVSIDTAHQDLGGTRAPFSLATQGTLFVGGRLIHAPGTHDPTLPHQTPRTYDSDGQSYWVDQLYAEYQIPETSRGLPTILVHGGSCTGAVWDGTPDGREGLRTLLVRRGFPTYVVDLPRRGRSGFPSFNGRLGDLADEQVVPDRTCRAGIEWSWVRWRLGPRFAERFAHNQFPVENADDFYRSLVPTLLDDADTVTDALLALLEKVGPAILITHSQSGVFGWLTAGRTELVRAIVAYEPTLAFPAGRMSTPAASVSGVSIEPGVAIPEEEFERLSSIPIQVVFGDNIPSKPVRETEADGRRNHLRAAQQFVDELNARESGARHASLVHLPDCGLLGNSHFMFQDRNNEQVAELFSEFVEHADIRAR